MDLPAYITQRKDGVCVAIKVQPRASRNAIGEVLGNELKITVTAPPVDSAANDALLDFIADRLDCSRAAVKIVGGSTSRHKQIIVHGVAATEIAERLRQ